MLRGGILLVPVWNLEGEVSDSRKAVWQSSVVGAQPNGKEDRGSLSVLQSPS